MIIYNTQLGDKELIMKAVEYRDRYKPLLRGVVCHICSKDTFISWSEDNKMSPIIKACCEEFQKKVVNNLRLLK